MGGPAPSLHRESTDSLILLGPAWFAYFLITTNAVFPGSQFNRSAVKSVGIIIRHNVEVGGVLSDAMI